MFSAVNRKEEKEEEKEGEGGGRGRGGLSGECTYFSFIIYIKQGETVIMFNHRITFNNWNLMSSHKMSLFFKTYEMIFCV